ncbi:MAG: Crp/Fnr family transcriptional regulator, partial [Treponema sp.]|nr:Crp/Fnr family transcriptional regulator [Treponema sp.]
RRIKIILIKDIQVRICDVFLMYDETHSSAQEDYLMGSRRTFKVGVNDIAHWAGIPVSKADEELERLAERNKIQVFDDYINVMNIHDIKRIVDAYYNNLDAKLK